MNHDARRRILDPIVKYKYAHNPGKLAAWLSASHIEKAPKKTIPFFGLLEIMLNLSKSYCFAICVIFLSFSASFGQVKNERQEGDYIGPVWTARTETIKYSFDKGKLKSGKRKLESVEIFDRSGNYIRNLEYDDDGVPNWDQKTFVSKNGRAIGWQVSDPHFKGLPNKFYYKYDDAGNIIEQYSYREDGTLSNQWKYAYDKQNRKLSEIYLSNTPPEHTNYSYDEKGRVIEIAKFVNGEKGLVPRDKDGYHRKVLIYTTGNRWDVSLSFLANGQLMEIRRVSRDSKGNETEESAYDASGILKSRIRYEYKFDNRGNWIVQKTFRWKTEDGKSFYRLDEVSYRAIRYFRK